MAIHPLAGKPAPPEVLIDPQRLERDYYALRPDPKIPAQRVAFGTSGHRGSPESGSFNEAHIAAITQAICEYRKGKGIDGPLYLGRDTHAVSPAAERTALEVLAAHGVTTIVQERDQPAPTPSISRAILAWNRGKKSGLADGIVVTPSHNPPSDGGFKYNPPDGGPADTDVTGWVEARANALLGAEAADVQRVPYAQARRAATTRAEDLIRPYVRDLAQALDLDAVRAQGVRIGIDPLGGAAAPYWEVVREEYGLAIEVVNPAIDPTFRFMRLDHDGKIRMDCSSPYAMAGLVEMKDRFDVAFGNDADADRHGIVTPGSGLLNPNHYLAVAIEYLLEHRPGWPKGATVGKTLVTSGLVDRVVAAAGRKVYEVPVGFKWFVQGLFDGSCCFGGEESAGAAFLRKDGTAWTTDKDGLLLGLLAAEITAVTGMDPGERARALRERVGAPHYIRIDTPATPAQKTALKNLDPSAIKTTSLAGDAIVDILTRAPGNGAAIGGLKVTTDGGWFAARPSGTENVCKLYAESFRSKEHLEKIVTEAQVLIDRATTGA
jgi:phosphoglucomutase